MRTRSEAKRHEIIEAAARAFEELGYERTSMLTIAERMSGSKQTLYNYFASKEDLLRAVLADSLEQSAQTNIAEFMAEAAVSLRKALVRAGVGYLTHQLSPSTVALFRDIANMPAESTLGPEFFETAVRSAWRQVAAAFQTLMREGKLRRADPWLAAIHFKGLMLQDLLERQLLCAAEKPDPKEIEAAAKHGADAFLRIYDVEEPKKRRNG